MANIRVGILEKDGEEYDEPVEYLLLPEDVPFSDPGFTATDTKAAIIEAKAAASDVLPPDYISTTFTVPVNRQLVLSQNITIAVGGNLIINGRVRIL